MPAYNAAQLIGESIQSVIDQEWDNWELIIVDDGSTDGTDQITAQFEDRRIRCFKKQNGGVSSARNMGLSKIRGDLFCFLDADDLMTSDSISSRHQIFANHPELEFVGGGQLQMDQDLVEDLQVQLPDYWGNPMKGLIQLDPGCFINCGTWLIRKMPDKQYHFQEGLTHCEDLTFFFQMAGEGILGFTKQIVQVYRRGPATAMTNLDGLEEGYQYFYSRVKESDKVSFWSLLLLRFKIMKIMFLSFLACADYGRAFGSLVTFIKM